MNEDQGLDSTRRITSSDDLEVSAYLEISQEKAGYGLASESEISPQRDVAIVNGLVLSSRLGFTYSGKAKATKLPPLGRPDFPPPAEITTNCRPFTM